MKTKNFSFHKDTQRENPLLKDLADIVKKYDLAGGFLMVIEKPGDEDISIVSYHRKGMRPRLNSVLQLIDKFIVWYQVEVKTMIERERFKQFGNQIADYWYNNLHMKYAPIFQKQKLSEYIQRELHWFCKLL